MVRELLGKAVPKACGALLGLSGFHLILLINDLISPSNGDVY